MTQSKREPFSVILLEYSDAGGQTYSVEVFGTKIAGNFGLDGSNRKCAELNAAFNARVDEEVRKAVEKFRERAEIVVRQECGGKCGGDRGCEISRKIMEIPTEPEVK